MRESMDVEQECQKTYYDRSNYGPNYKVGEEVLLFNPTKKILRNTEIYFFL